MLEQQKNTKKKTEVCSNEYILNFTEKKNEKYIMLALT
jgi:hypothetical protein